MANERPANYLPPAVSYGALVCIVLAFSWILLGGPTSLEELSERASTRGAAVESFVAAPAESRPSTVTDAQWRDIKSAEYRKRAAFSGIYLGMSFDDLRQHAVWLSPESVGALHDDGTQSLFYRVGFKGELVQLVFSNGRLGSVQCDPACQVDERTRRQLGL